MRIWYVRQFLHYPREGPFFSILPKLGFFRIGHEQRREFPNLRPLGIHPSHCKPGRSIFRESECSHAACSLLVVDRVKDATLAAASFPEALE